MDLSTIENIQNTAGWPQAIEVWQFDRSKGSTNIGVRKKTQPCKVTPISQTLKDIYVKNTGSVLEDPKKSSEQLSFSLLPLKFCKKDITTGIQKQLRCKVCKCLMESTNALKSHLQSAKHVESFKNFEANAIPDEYRNAESKVKDDEINDLHNGIEKRTNDGTTVLQIKESKRRKLESKGEKNKRITDRPGFGQDKYDETSYYFDQEKELRKVYPYYFTFTTFTKGRWVGDTILDIFSREFRAHSAEEYKRCIETGTLTVNGNKVEPEYILQHNDMLANIVHRHEVPVTSKPIRIVHMDYDLVVVDKPPSIPVHPCGRYRYNSVVYILAKEFGLKFLKTIHRIDRLTSGLLLIGRTPQKAHEMEQQIQSRNVRKVYVCRVEGKFPITEEGDTESDVKGTDESKLRVTCSQPIEVVSYKIGVCRVSSQGKPCRTDFERLSYNGKTSVVLCRPHTGRMHQIRVHLQYLGYPIVNDPLYNSSAFGPSKGKGGDIGGKTYEDLIKDLIFLHNAENWADFESDTPSKSISSNLVSNSNSLPNTATIIVKDATNDQSQMNRNDKEILSSDSVNLSEVESFSENIDTIASVPEPNEFAVSSTELADEINLQNKMFVEKDMILETNQPSLDKSKLSFDSNCKECALNFNDPTEEQLVMYLHAYKYSGANWSYETKLPDWADEHWEGGPTNQNNVSEFTKFT